MRPFAQYIPIELTRHFVRLIYVNRVDTGQKQGLLMIKTAMFVCAHKYLALSLHQKTQNKDNTWGVKKHPTRLENVKLRVLKKGKEIMKRMMKRIGESKKFNNYCMNMLRMYGYGKVNLPA